MIIDNEYGTQGPRMSCKLTFLGVIWSILSLIIPIIISIAYYMPYWLVGSYHGIIQVSFGSFRRCNYPHMKNDGSIEIVKECGRYTTFGDIPSLSWQITTILVGAGTAASLLVGFTVLAGCCLSDVITKSTSRTLGLIQLISAFLITIGCAFYPLGWNSKEVKDTCSDASDVYKIGSCQLSWSFYALLIGSFIVFICFLLSFKASKVKLRRTFTM